MRNPIQQLLKPYDRNGLNFKNRIVLAPMTRCQANTSQIPSENMHNFYHKRSACGLLITEATGICPHANTHPNTPGIYSAKQIQAWRRISNSVQDQGSKLFMQLWHPGMMAHSVCSNNSLPLSPSGIKPLRKLVPRLKIPYETPKIMNSIDFFNVKNSFLECTDNAIHKAGFDGIELHAASGYLLDSFLHYSTNKRTDDYGGTPENMTRFLLEIIQEIITIIPSNKVAIRISPVPLPNMQSLIETEDDQHVFRYLLKKLELLNIAYIHVSSDNDTLDQGFLSSKVSTFVRNNYNGTVIAGGNYSIYEAESALINNEFDLAYFGRLLVANPNLVHLLANNDLSNLSDFHFSMIDSPP